CAYISGAFVECANVARVIVVIYNLIAICHDSKSSRGKPRLSVRFGGLARRCFFRCLLHRPTASSPALSAEGCWPHRRWLVCLPLNLGQVNSLFHHFVKRRKLTKFLHDVDD